MSAALITGTIAPATQTHTISLFVHDRPGVLVRIALVFSRRGYNIESLVVSPSASGGFSRMTITCSGDPNTLDEIIRQLAKLIDVVRATDHTGDELFGGQRRGEHADRQHGCADQEQPRVADEHVADGDLAAQQDEQRHVEGKRRDQRQERQR